MQNVRKTSNNPRGSTFAPRRNAIEGLGVDKTAYLMHGPIVGFSNEIGHPDNPYKSEAEARKDWKAHRTELMALCTDLTRRPWAYWEYDLDMDCPSGGDQAQVIVDMGLARNKAESEYLDLWLAGEWLEAVKIHT